MNMLPKAIRELLKETLKPHGIVPNTTTQMVNSFVVENATFRVIGANINFDFDLVLLLPMNVEYEKIEPVILSVVESFGNAEGNNIDDVENSRKLLIFRVSQSCVLRGA